MDNMTTNMTNKKKHCIDPTHRNKSRICFVDTDLHVHQKWSLCVSKPKHQMSWFENTTSFPMVVWKLIIITMKIAKKIDHDGFNNTILSVFHHN